MVINGNALLIPLASKCVHTIVTSPPYYGHRQYGIGTDNGEIGLEQSPDEYIINLVNVFRECKRVLRDDGTLWVNIGDSYAHSLRQAGEKYAGNMTRNSKGVIVSGYKPLQEGYKEKDLIGISWMLAFALQVDGWYLRQDIIWAKPNPMPESVKDRCTRSHEYIFLLSKSRRYYYNSDAIKEPYVSKPQPPRNKSVEDWNNSFPGGRTSSGAHDYYANGGKNKRDVWTVTVKPYKGAHYATFNPELIKPCILAGAPEGGVVFDPFVGSGTTVATAIQLGRNGIGLDLSLKYLYNNAKVRIEQTKMETK